MAVSEKEAGEQAPLLVNALQQLELPALERLADKLWHPSWVGSLRLTCRALRDLVDGSVRLPKRLTVHLREDGRGEPLAALERWRRRGDSYGLEIELPAEAPGGVNVLLPPALTELPEHVRRRVVELIVRRSPQLEYPAPGPPVSGAAVGALAVALPRLRKLDLSSLQSWTPDGGAGEAYAALAALGTLEELELPRVPGLTGVEALAGSLRSLKVLGYQPFTLSAAAPLGRLTRLEELYLPRVDLWEGSTLQNLLRLLPPSLTHLHAWLYCPMVVAGYNDVLCDFGISGGRLMSADLGYVLSQALTAVARDELLPCLGPSGRLESLNADQLIFDSLWTQGWGTVDLTPAMELWKRSDSTHVTELAVRYKESSADICSALTAFGPFATLRLGCSGTSCGIDLRLPLRSRPSRTLLLDLPPPEEVLRMAVPLLTRGGRGSAAGVDGAGRHILLLRGPAAVAALEQPSSEAAVKAWARDLGSRSRAAAGPALAGEGPIIKYAMLLPPASSVLLECSKEEGVAEALVAAVAAAGDGSKAARVQAADWCSSLVFPLGEALQQVVGELWAASACEGGPSLHQRVEWAVGVTDLISSLPFHSLYS